MERTHENGTETETAAGQPFVAKYGTGDAHERGLPDLPDVHSGGIGGEGGNFLDAGAVPLQHPAHKDEVGSGAYDRDGIVQRALRHAKEAYPDFLLVADLCMCEYTSHGHCGILCGREVDNDATLAYLQKIAVSQAQAGADVIAPSDMMDGRVAAIRAALDGAGFSNIPIMAYSAKFASSFYGPFRDAADSAPGFGDRRRFCWTWRRARTW